MICHPAQLIVPVRLPPRFIFHKGWISPWKVFIAMALLLLSAALCQSWFPHKPSASLWFSLSFTSQPSSALQSQRSSLNKPIASSGPFPDHEMELALPPSRLQPNPQLLPYVPNENPYLQSNITSKYGIEPSDAYFASSDESSNEKTDTMRSISTSGHNSEAEVLPEKLILESSEKKADMTSLNFTSSDNGEDEALPDQLDMTSLNVTTSDNIEDKAVPDELILQNSEKKADMTSLNSTNIITIGGEQSHADTNTSTEIVTPKGSSNSIPMSVNGSKVFSPKEDRHTSIQEVYPKKQAWVRKLEDDLHRAKEVIVNATAVADSGLYSPVYHNITKFVKSYKMMEEIFRIYTYHEGKPPLVHDGPTMGIYASEGQFIHGMQHSHKFVAKDPKEAHTFFLPYSVVNMVTELYVPGSHSMLPLATFIKDYVNLIASKYPYWNRTRGADHFFVSCHDWGPATARDHQELRQNAMKVVCNADLTEEFVLEKDSSLPEIYIHSSRRFGRVGGPGPGRRPYLAFFAGQMHGRVRPVLLQYWKDKDPDMKIYEVLPSSVARKTSYYKYMKQSRFCICAMGYEVNSPRIVEAIYYDCVPVIIADNFVLPFSEVLNWAAFSVTVKEKEIPNLRTILLNISDKRYRAMQSNLKYVRRHFMWHKAPVKYDVFHMILHSVWLRRLHQIKPVPVI